MTRKMSGWLAMALLCAFGPFAMCLAADPPVKTGEKRDTLIYVRTDPPGAKVLLDGKELGKTNGLFPVDAGVATIVLELEGHGQVKKQVTIEANKITRIELELKPAETVERKESETVAALRHEAESGNYFAKYRLWTGYKKGAEGIAKNREKAEKLLRELVEGVYLAKFRPTNGFAPTDPGEFLANFGAHSYLRSGPNGHIGGASFFRTTAKDGTLLGSFLTEYPDKMRKAIKDNPDLELISIEKLTPEMFIRYEASPQESLDAADDATTKKADVNQAVKQAVTTISHCGESDPDVVEALKSLRPLDHAEVVKSLIPHLDSSRDTIRRSAIYVLWHAKFIDIKPADIKPAVPALEKLLGHDETFTRGMAALALGQNKVSSSYDALVKMTASDSNGYARRCAAIALGWLGDPRAKPTLEAALKDSDPLVVANAKAALDYFAADKRPTGKAQEAAKDGTDAKVVEGVGWGGFRVGATREELVKAFGPLETSPGGVRKGWITRHHIDCWFDQAGRAVEVRFGEGFSAPLASGVKIGSPEKDVSVAYGTPDRVVDQSPSQMFEYAKRGVLLWITDGKVASFTVFKPRGSHSPSEKRHLLGQQAKARERMQQDVRAYSADERGEIESLYQVANQKWQTQEARDSLKTLVDKYKKANRTGCAILYLGQMNQGDDRIAYFKQAIADHSDCFYGDGVQVGAFARFLLGQTYRDNGNAELANALFDEIRKKYPDAVDHQGASLVEQLPQSESRDKPTKTPPAKDNILKNPGMEDGDQAPNDWEQGAEIEGVTYSWDKNVAFEGKASLCIEKSAQRYFPVAQWSQTVDRTGDSPALKVSAQVKAEKMTKAILDVLFLDRDGKWISHKWVAYIGGKQNGHPPANHDWKQYSGKVKIPPNTAKICIGLQVYGPGKVWFDDVRASYEPH